MFDIVEQVQRHFLDPVRVKLLQQHQEHICKENVYSSVWDGSWYQTQRNALGPDPRMIVLCQCEDGYV